MAVLNTTTGVLDLPKQKMEAWSKEIAAGSAVAALSGQIPMVFGPGQAFTFDIGEAEYVGESGVKGPSTVVPASQTVDPFKFHKTIRMSQEVKWADEDEQLRIIDQILAKIQPSLSRGLDYGVFHGINPTGGAAVAAMTQVLSATTNSVEIAAAKPYTYLDAADALVLAGSYLPSDAAIDPTWASGFASLRGTNSEVKMYPEFRLGTDVSDLDGHRASVARTVGAIGVAGLATNVKAFVGDFSAIQWGIQRQIGLELIEYGDPDGGGDLKRNNEIAFRAEVVYGWGIADLSAFTKIVDAVA